MKFRFKLNWAADNYTFHSLPLADSHWHCKPSVKRELELYTKLFTTKLSFILIKKRVCPESLSSKLQHEMKQPTDILSSLHMKKIEAEINFLLINRSKLPAESCEGGVSV